MNKTRIYYQPFLRWKDDESGCACNRKDAEGWELPDELMSFHAFASKGDAEKFVANMGYSNYELKIEEYHDDDIEGVTIIDSYGFVVEVNDDEDDETADRYFSEDLCAVLEGRMTSNEFRRLWGSISYDAMNCIINVGSNTIITNED